MAQLGLGTRCVQAGYSPKNGEPRQIPIIQSTTFKYESSAEQNRTLRIRVTASSAPPARRLAQSDPRGDTALFHP